MARPWLPAESAPRASRLGVAVAVALALVTLVAVNAAARALLARAGNNLGYRLMDEKWRLVREPPAGTTATPGAATPAPAEAPWLILGDSSGNQGADPETLGAALLGGGGRVVPVVNLCVIGDALVVHDAWILGAWIERHGPPAGVVVVHTYDVWHRGPSPGGNTSTAATLARVPVPLARWPLDPPVEFRGEHRAAFLAARYAPLYAERGTLADLIAHPRRTWRRVVDRGDIRWQWPREDGFMPTRVTRPQQALSDMRGQLWFLGQNRRMPPRRFEMSAENRSALERLAALAETHGFDVYLAAAPMVRGLWEAPIMQAYHADLRAALAEFDAAHGRVHIALGEPTPFEPEQMQNADHVALPAALEYSRRLAEAIRAMRR